jgi:hypothetical protein
VGDIGMSWTFDTITDRIEEAVDTMARLPTEGPAGYGSCMPDVVRSRFESYNQDGDPWGLYKNRRKPNMGPPASEAIDRATEVFEWLQWCARKDREVILRRASGERWYLIEGRFKRKRCTLDTWRKRGIQLIIDRLNDGVVLVIKGNAA